MFKFLKRLRGDKPIETPEVIEEIVSQPVAEVEVPQVAEAPRAEEPKPEALKPEKSKPAEKHAVAVQEVELP